MKDCKSNFKVHSGSSEELYKAEREKFINDKDFTTITADPKAALAKIPVNEILKTATWIATARCIDENLIIDDKTIKKNYRKAVPNVKVEDVPFWGHDHKNYTVVGNESCTFTVENKLKPIKKPE